MLSHEIAQNRDVEVHLHLRVIELLITMSKHVYILIILLINTLVFNSLSFLPSQFKTIISHRRGCFSPRTILR